MYGWVHRKILSLSVDQTQEPTEADFDQLDRNKAISMDRYHFDINLANYKKSALILALNFNF